MRAGCAFFVRSRAKTDIRSGLHSSISGLRGLRKALSVVRRARGSVVTIRGRYFHGVKFIGCGTFSGVNGGLDFTFAILSKGGSNFYLSDICKHGRSHVFTGPVIRKGYLCKVDRRRQRDLSGTLGCDNSVRTIRGSLRRWWEKRGYRSPRRSVSVSTRPTVVIPAGRDLKGAIVITIIPRGKPSKTPNHSANSVWRAHPHLYYHDNHRYGHYERQRLQIHFTSTSWDTKDPT